jgi:[ribosomal protein S18]-alanine N-acetyltransferase
MKFHIRAVKKTDLPIIADLDYEAFSPYGTAEKPEIFIARFRTFPNGFVVLEVDSEIAGYGCSEKWLHDREPGLDENPFETHHPDGRVFCITGMAVRINQRGKGYGLALLDRLIEIASQESCEKIILETTHSQGLYIKRGFAIVRSKQARGLTLDVMVLELV